MFDSNEETFKNEYLFLNIINSIFSFKYINLIIYMDGLMYFLIFSNIHLLQVSSFHHLLKPYLKDLYQFRKLLV
jgi:hypothetical protein